MCALYEWSPETEAEPTGWIRAIGALGSIARRRVDGDPAQEYLDGDEPPAGYGQPGQKETA